MKFIDGTTVPEHYLQAVSNLVRDAADQDPGEENEADVLREYARQIEVTEVPHIEASNLMCVSYHAPDCASRGKPEWTGSPNPSNPSEEWICDDCGAVIPATPAEGTAPSSTEPQS